MSKFQFKELAKYNDIVSDNGETFLDTRFEAMSVLHRKGILKPNTSFVMFLVTPEIDEDVAQLDEIGIDVKEMAYTANLKSVFKTKENQEDSFQIFEFETASDSTYVKMTVPFTRRIFILESKEYYKMLEGD